MVVFINTVCFFVDRVCFEMKFLSSESVEGAALSLESVDYIECSNSLPASVLSVCDCVSDDILEEDL